MAKLLPFERLLYDSPLVIKSLSNRKELGVI